MVDITHKSNTLRKAVATAVVEVSLKSTIDAIQERKVPKGDVFEFARVAGFFGIKNTSSVIPDCHPLPVEFSAITYEVIDLSVIINVEVHTIYKTGVEVEAMYGASVAALVMYDMLKPIDKNVQIKNIRLLEKTGGKSDNKKDFSHLKAAVVVCSDSVSKGEKQDTAGKTIVSELEKNKISCVNYEIIPDDFDLIQKTAIAIKDKGIDLIIFTGGTGLSSRDVTPDAILPLIDRSIPGIMEAARDYGQNRIKTAMLSRSIAGFMGNTLILTFPGSQKASQEYMYAIFPQVLHIFDIKNGEGH
ncbi:bifunctional molybdenum cofactor biosynthesis protein MoaC/MoaB [Epilithonimonas sp. UC225_85]|uniref:bifunctional molybdenum cofactor biosynthesis protein MoaC/MoaB n=1 Tax=Epilithonimonas sp. UC225_85 TaxID=3350167 RepID=UPI0036D246A3